MNTITSHIEQLNIKIRREAAYATLTACNGDVDGFNKSMERIEQLKGVVAALEARASGVEGTLAVRKARSWVA